MKGDLTWSGEHTVQYTDDILQNCTPDTHIILLTNVTPINTIKNIFSKSTPQQIQKSNPTFCLLIILSNSPINFFELEKCITPSNFQIQKLMLFYFSLHFQRKRLAELTHRYSDSCSHLTAATVNNSSICNPHRERTLPPMDCVYLGWLMILNPTSTKVIQLKEPFQSTHKRGSFFPPSQKFPVHFCPLTHLPSRAHYSMPQRYQRSEPTHQIPAINLA